MLDTLFIFGAKYLLLAVAGIVLIYLLKQPRDEQKRILIFAAFTLPLTYVLSRVSGLLYFDPRPFVVGHFVPLIPHEADNGFPSDHVLLCASLAAIVYPSSKRLSMALWALTVLVGVSRVCAGIHHPVDIIGSIFMAIVVAWLVYRALSSSLFDFRWFRKQIQGRREP